MLVELIDLSMQDVLKRAISVLTATVVGWQFVEPSTCSAAYRMMLMKGTSFLTAAVQG